MFVNYLKAIKLPEIFEVDINNTATINKGRFMATPYRTFQNVLPEKKYIADKQRGEEIY